MIKQKKRRIFTLSTIILTFFLLQETTSSQEGQGVANSMKTEYKAGGLKDPFQEEKIGVENEPIETGPLPSVTIQGIVWGSALPQAIINNKVVKVGDTVEQMQILEISKNGIIVLYGNQKHNLSAPSVVQLDNIKKKSEGGTNEDKN